MDAQKPTQQQIDAQAALDVAKRKAHQMIEDSSTFCIVAGDETGKAEGHFHGTPMFLSLVTLITHTMAQRKLGI